MGAVPGRLPSTPPRRLVRFALSEETELQVLGTEDGLWINREKVEKGRFGRKRQGKAEGQGGSPVREQI